MIHDLTAAAVAVRWLLFLALMLLAGLPWFAGWLQRHVCAGLARPLPTLACAWAGAALVALALAAVQLLQITARMAGVGVHELDADTLGWVVGQTPLGHAWLLRSALLLTLAGLAWAWRRQPVGARRLGWLAALGMTSLATLPWNGHAGAGEGWHGWLQLGVDVVHLGAAAAWAGALAGFCVLALARSNRWLAALMRFLRPGLSIVAVLALTGLVRTHELVGWTWAAWTQSAYAGWLLLKLALFAAMLALAWRNRRQALSPGARGPAHQVFERHVRWRLYGETLLLVAVVAVVAVLGMTGPPMTPGG
ncbi:MAG: Copper resistance protein D [Paracidovorax wautersii]|uniref:Copper resistance protein D n=1 Tax=Paracidovorax wautersii TaxID=1177982 RepID=A0A7V8JQ68_9BURK|nr:MAG: Copper resistance protein D [Paracidovorax wautersii]